MKTEKIHLADLLAVTKIKGKEENNLVHVCACVCLCVGIAFPESLFVKL